MFKNLQRYSLRFVTKSGIMIKLFRYFLSFFSICKKHFSDSKTIFEAVFRYIDKVYYIIINIVCGKNCYTEYLLHRWYSYRKKLCLIFRTKKFVPLYSDLMECACVQWAAVKTHSSEIIVAPHSNFQLYSPAFQGGFKLWTQHYGVIVINYKWFNDPLLPWNFPQTF